MDQRTYETLTSLPLLRGISAFDLNRLLENAHTRIVSLQAGMTWVEQDEPCHQLAMLMSGTLRREQQTDIMRITEWQESPSVIEPEVAYGARTRYTATYKAQTDCQLFTIDRAALSHLFMTIDVLHINYMNMLANALQHAQQTQLSAPKSLEERCMRFLQSNTRTGKGHKLFAVRMKDIGEHLSTSRVLVSRALHNLQEAGKVRFTRENIEII